MVSNSTIFIFWASSIMIPKIIFYELSSRSFLGGEWIDLSRTCIEFLELYITYMNFLLLILRYDFSLIQIYVGPRLIPWRCQKTVIRSWQWPGSRGGWSKGDQTSRINWSSEHLNMKASTVTYSDIQWPSIKFWKGTKELTYENFESKNSTYFSRAGLWKGGLNTQKRIF